MGLPPSRAPCPLMLELIALLECAPYPVENMQRRQLLCQLWALEQKALDTGAEAGTLCDIRTAQRLVHTVTGAPGERPCCVQ
jgi:hypothetical protein